MGDKVEMYIPDEFFAETEDVTREGMLGGYVHGNEPSHHIPYLYMWTTQPWKTQYWVREVMNRMYRNHIDGLCGNDDCGQMSAWYIFSAMGFYPVCPASGQYVIGAPYLPYMKVRMGSGKYLEIKAPKVSDKDLTDAISRLDSVKADIAGGKHTFEEMALLISQDKDSRNNNGNMLNEKNHSSRFEMADLPTEVGKKISSMQPGDVSEPFVMVNPKTRREQVAIVKLVKRIDGHKADLGEDYMIIKDMCEANTKEQILRDWVIKKQKSVYVYIEEGWRNCDFKYDWLKNGK